jgi:hypothetical protein
VAHLGEGADGLGEAAANGFDAGDEGASWVAELGVDDIVEAVPFCAAIFRVADRLVSLAERRGRNFTAGIAVR